MSEARAICGRCGWSGLVDITPVWPMGLQSCPQCAGRALRYAGDLRIYRAYGPIAHEPALRHE